MAGSITYRTISGVDDGRYSLSNSWKARKWDASYIPATWTTLRVGICLNILDVTPLSGEGLFVGICSGTTNPMGTETPAHFLGVNFHQALDGNFGTGVTAGGKKYFNPNQATLFKVENGVESDVSNINSTCRIFRGVSQRSALFIEITKGSPYSVNIAKPSSDAALDVDITLDQFKIMMEQALSSMSNGYTAAAADTVTIDTGTYGDWDAVGVSWATATANLEDCVIIVNRIA